MATNGEHDLFGGPGVCLGDKLPATLQHNRVEVARLGRRTDEPLQHIDGPVSASVGSGSEARVLGRLGDALRQPPT